MVSLYEKLYSGGEGEFQQQIVQNFMGDNADAWWTDGTAVWSLGGGSGTFDFERTTTNYGALLTPSGTGVIKCLDNNDKKAFRAPCSCYFIIKMGCGDGLNAKVGFGDSNSETENPTWGASARYNNQTITNFQLEVNKTSGTTNTDTGVAQDEDFHSNRIDIDYDRIDLTIDGILRATKEGSPGTYAGHSNTIHTSMQARIFAQALNSSSSRTLVINYYEAWNL